MKLIRYLKNLWFALTGRNLYREALVKTQRQRDNAEQDILNYQNLTENLRQRVSEKDLRIEDLRRYYSALINALRSQHKVEREVWQTKEQELREDLDIMLEQLKHVNQDIGREKMSTNLLHKTNAALNDLCQAMTSEDVVKMKHAVEYLDWSNPLSQIARLHLNVLLRAGTASV